MDTVSRFSWLKAFLPFLGIEAFFAVMLAQSLSCREATLAECADGMVAVNLAYLPMLGAALIAGTIHRGMKRRYFLTATVLAVLTTAALHFACKTEDSGSCARLIVAGICAAYTVISILLMTFRGEFSVARTIASGAALTVLNALQCFLCLLMLAKD